MKNNGRTLGTTLLQLALALMFIVGGIWTLQNGAGDEISSAIRQLFNGDAARILCIVFGVIEIITGVFLFIRLFTVLATTLDTLLMIIIMICWIVCIVLVDFTGSNGLLQNLNSGFLPWVNRFARHLLVLGAIVKVKG